MATPPQVPTEFWHTKDMQAALQSCHMGKVIRAFREHLHHGRRGYSQSDVAAWAHTSQARISRLENGPPILRLDHLDFWAKLLGIPQEHLWFKLPENRGGRATPAAGDGDDDDWERQVAPVEDTWRTEIALGWDADDGTEDGRVMTEPPQRSSEVEGKSDSAVSREATRRDGDRDLTPTLPNPPIHIDIETAQPARIADYLLGGTANFAVDREAIDYVTEPLPGGTDIARATAHATQAFRVRATRFLVGETAIRQILYIGTRLPTGTRIHHVAQEIAPDCRVVYVIDDDVTMAHAHQLRQSTPEGASTYLRAHLSDTTRILEHAADTIDYDQPVGIMVQGLHHIDDDDDAHRIITNLTQPMASGSYVVLGHLTDELLGNKMAEAIRRLDQMVSEAKMPTFTLRSRARIARILEGLQLVEPGIAPMDDLYWDSAHSTWQNAQTTLMYAAVGRKI